MNRKFFNDYRSVFFSWRAWTLRNKFIKSNIKLLTILFQEDTAPNKMDKNLLVFVFKVWNGRFLRALISTTLLLATSFTIRFFPLFGPLASVTSTTRPRRFRLRIAGKADSEVIKANRNNTFAETLLHFRRGQMCDPRSNSMTASASASTAFKPDINLLWCGLGTAPWLAYCTFSGTKSKPER